MNLILGTAQLGLDYGISNADGPVHRAEAQAILSLARDVGLTDLDTAVEYGSSESVLGETLATLSADWRVTTKVSAGAGCRAEWEHSVVASRLRLRRPIHTVLCHRATDWTNNPEFRSWLFDLRARGVVSQIGVSVYEVSEADAAIALGPDIVQVPLNVLDRRFVSCGVLSRLASAGVRVQVRSVFLQGLLFMPNESLPPELRGLIRPLDEIRAIAKADGLTSAALSLAWVGSLPEISGVVIGVTSAEQLAWILEASRIRLSEAALTAVGAISPAEPRLTDPRKWPVRAASHGS